MNGSKSLIIACVNLMQVLKKRQKSFKKIMAANWQNMPTAADPSKKQAPSK